MHTDLPCIASGCVLPPGVVSGVDNDTNWDSRNTNDSDIGGSGLHSAAAGDALKSPDCGVTGACLIQEGTGAATGGDTGLDWVLSDGDGDEEGVESAPPQHRRAAAEGARGESE